MSESKTHMAQDALASKIWVQAMTSGDPVAVAAASKTREAIQLDCGAVQKTNRPTGTDNGPEPGYEEPETSQEPSA